MLKSDIYVEFPYLCPNYNTGISIQIVIYISKLSYMYPNGNIYVQNVNTYISKFANSSMYICQFFEIYIFSGKYYM